MCVLLITTPGAVRALQVPCEHLSGYLIARYLEALAEETGSTTELHGVGYCLERIDSLTVPAEPGDQPD